LNNGEKQEKKKKNITVQRIASPVFSRDMARTIERYIKKAPFV